MPRLAAAPTCTSRTSTAGAAAPTSGGRSPPARSRRSGAGSVDLAGVLGALADIGYDGVAVVEQDRLPGQGDPVADLRASREHLETLLGAPCA